jgi:hypothetical protein
LKKIFDERRKVMKKLKYAALVLAIINFMFTGYAFCGEEKITSHNNEYSGKTEETKYSKGSDKYEEGIQKIVEYYDGNGKIREIESYYTDERSKKDGVKKREQYYYQSSRATKLFKTQFYYTESYANGTGIYKCEEKYNEHGNKETSEFLYTDAWSKKKVVARMVIDWDRKGTEKRRTHYDQKGNIISKEEK